MSAYGPIAFQGGQEGSIVDPVAPVHIGEDFVALINSDIAREDLVSLIDVPGDAVVNGDGVIVRCQRDGAQAQGQDQCQGHSQQFFHGFHGGSPFFVNRWVV